MLIVLGKRPSRHQLFEDVHAVNVCLLRPSRRAALPLVYLRSPQQSGIVLLGAEGAIEVVLHAFLMMDTGVSLQWQQLFSGHFAALVALLLKPAGYVHECCEHRSFHRTLVLSDIG